MYSEMPAIELHPIGVFYGEYKEKYEAPKQGVLSQEPGFGEVRIFPGNNFEQALEDIVGFERLWLIFYFNKAQSWKPKILPPHYHKKVSVWASRSPHRPNFIGMSCVSLIRREGLCLKVADYDLLDNTPILDIKPYLPYSDSFPDAELGWCYQPSSTYLIHQDQSFEKPLQKQVMRGVINRLKYYPYPKKYNRITQEKHGYCIAYKHYRLYYEVDEENKKVLLKSLSF